jgi:hypothetical protein
MTNEKWLERGGGDVAVRVPLVAQLFSCDEPRFISYMDSKASQVSHEFLRMSDLSLDLDPPYRPENSLSRSSENNQKSK